LTSEQHNEALTAAFKEKPIKGFDRMVEELRKPMQTLALSVAEASSSKC
jgi:hypothetical protein